MSRTVVPPIAKECDSKRICYVQTYKPKTTLSSRKLKQYHYLFLFFYILTLYWTISTIGKPYENFLKKADVEGLEVMQGLTKMRAEFEYQFQEVNDPNRKNSDKMGWLDWMEMDIEDHVEQKKRLKEQNVLDSLPKHMRVPKKYMPDFWPMFCLGVLGILHALLVLLQLWSVAFDTWLNYQIVNLDSFDFDDEEALAKKNLPTHARITPSNTTEKDVLLPLQYHPTLGLTFTYHRRRFVFDNNQLWSKIRCRTDIPLSLLTTWTGLDAQIAAAQLRFGPNTFDIPQPSFADLYKAQLTSPFTVFQIFCVGLWMLDDYWQYSLFTLFMVLMFEATVVYSRIKSLGMLRGMGNQPRSVYVYRKNEWRSVLSSELLPGDLLSLTKLKEEGGDVVPADVVLLHGSAVVNEASLTGESVPQMKQGVTMEQEEEFDMKGKHKLHVLYGGTKLMQCKGATETDGKMELPPDNGSITFVLRTGFTSSQGKLVRMIEGSQEKVKGHEKETALLLFLLFCFAVASSSYVLYHGYDSKRSRYELLLHCILIITSVIPPELPMQMALAVNTSLMTLMKMQVFCTEPYRVPIAGKLDACLFDKTGTLTTDELVAVGVSTSKSNELMLMSQIHNEAALVLASCHSLVYIENETVGDPLEAAALASIRWSMNENGTILPAVSTEKRVAGKEMNVDRMSVKSIDIMGRHHFNSKLQRMSCTVKDQNKRCFVVSKGSPEAIGALLRFKPDWYDSQSQFLSKKGYRVLALAYKAIHNEHEYISSRAKSEQELNFAGFVCFTCRVRKDTKRVINRLREGGMSVAMITGDALLTAVHVAKEVDICSVVPQKIDEAQEMFERETNEELKKLLSQRRQKKVQKNTSYGTAKPILILQHKGDLFWESYDNNEKVASFDAIDIPNLAKKYDLAVTGKVWNAAYSLDSETMTKMVQYIQVFARMTPDAKEHIIQCFHTINQLCLMCGDGANDVGALKQADVGVALLSGFGDVNVDKGDDSYKKKKEDYEKENKNQPTAIMSREQLEILRKMPVYLLKTQIRALGVEPNNYPDLIEKEDLVSLYRIKATERAVKRHDAKVKNDNSKMTKAEQAAKAKAELAKKQQKMQERIQELQAKGESWAMFKALKEFTMAEAEEKRKNAKEMSQKNSIEGSAANIAAQLDDLELDDIPMVKIGDASVAAPFTSKMPSIKSCVDIVRQGRCTLVTSIQMYQILALNCLISSYSLSVLYLDGVKYGDTQMTAIGLLSSISFMSVSRSKPLDRLSPVKPLTSIFHPSLFLSLLGQFSVHLFTMMMAVRLAKEHLPPDYTSDLEGVFKPGILNSVVFLVSNVQHVTVFAVNLQGRPFMNGLTENRPLLWSLLATFILTFMFASESVPSLNKYFQLVPFPSDEFRNNILLLLGVDVALCLVFDRILKLIFCRQILMASLADTTIWDVLRLGRTVAVIFFIMNTFLGNDETWDEMLRQEALAMNDTAIDQVEELLNNSIVEEGISVDEL